MSMTDDILKVCISADEIHDMVVRIGAELNQNYKDKNPLFIGVLKGAVPFMTDLLKQITIRCTEDYVRISSYRGKESTGNIEISGKFPNVKGREVIVVEDILDTGKTLLELRKLLLAEGALSVSICVLLDKPEGRRYDITADYVGGKVPNEFVVGYGLDYNEQYRNLPYIGVLKEEVYKK